MLRSWNLTHTLSSHNRPPPVPQPRQVKGAAGRGRRAIVNGRHPALITNRARRASPLGTWHLHVGRCMRSYCSLRSSPTRGFDRHGQIARSDGWYSGCFGCGRCRRCTSPRYARARALAWRRKHPPLWTVRFPTTARAAREALTDDPARYSSVHHKRRMQKLLGLLPLNCLRLPFKLLAAAPCLGASTRQLRLGFVVFFLVTELIFRRQLSRPAHSKTLGQSPPLGPWSLSWFK